MKRFRCHKMCKSMTSKPTEMKLRTIARLHAGQKQQYTDMHAIMFAFQLVMCTPLLFITCMPRLSISPRALCAFSCRICPHRVFDAECSGKLLSLPLTLSCGTSFLLLKLARQEEKALRSMILTSLVPFLHQCRNHCLMFECCKAISVFGCIRSHMCVKDPLRPILSENTLGYYTRRSLAGARFFAYLTPWSCAAFLFWFGAVWVGFRN